MPDPEQFKTNPPQPTPRPERIKPAQELAQEIYRLRVGEWAEERTFEAYVVDAIEEMIGERVLARKSSPWRGIRSPQGPIVESEAFLMPDDTIEKIAAVFGVVPQEVEDMEAFQFTPEQRRLAEREGVLPRLRRGDQNISRDDMGALIEIPGILQHVMLHMEEKAQLPVLDDPEAAALTESSAMPQDAIVVTDEEQLWRHVQVRIEAINQVQRVRSV